MSSGKRPASISLNSRNSPHCSAVTPARVEALAGSLPMVVLPTPLVPLNRNREAHVRARARSRAHAARAPGR